MPPKVTDLKIAQNHGEAYKIIRNLSYPVSVWPVTPENEVANERYYARGPAEVQRAVSDAFESSGGYSVGIRPFEGKNRNKTDTPAPYD